MENLKLMALDFVRKTRILPIGRFLLERQALCVTFVLESACQLLYEIEARLEPSERVVEANPKITHTPTEPTQPKRSGGSENATTGKINPVNSNKVFDTVEPLTSLEQSQRLSNTDPLMLWCSSTRNQKTISN